MFGRGLRFHKGKLLIFAASFLIALYGISAAFYGKVVAKDDAYKELSVFMDVLRRVSDDYVEAPDMSNVQEGAMRGLIDALDPYCSFLSKEQYEALQKRKESGNAGLGIVLSKRSEIIYIVSCERDSPAQEALQTFLLLPQARAGKVRATADGRAALAVALEVIEESRKAADALVADGR